MILVIGATELITFSLVELSFVDESTVELVVRVVAVTFGNT